MRSPFRKLAAAVLLAALSLPALAAEKLVVGAYPSNPPWEAKNEKGEFEGFEVDLVKAIAKKLNREVELQDLGFQALFAATSSGRIDVAISTITITPERLKSSRSGLRSTPSFARRGPSAAWDCPSRLPCSPASTPGRWRCHWRRSWRCCGSGRA